MEFGPHLLLAMLEGLVQASVLTLTALGLSLVFGVMRVVNVAHGEFFMLGAVLAWWITTMLGGSPEMGFTAALFIAPLLVGLLAGLADWLILRRVDYDPERTIVATIGEDELRAMGQTVEVPGETQSLEDLLFAGADSTAADSTALPVSARLPLSGLGRPVWSVVIRRDRR